MRWKDSSDHRIHIYIKKAFQLVQWNLLKEGGNNLKSESRYKGGCGRGVFTGRSPVAEWSLSGRGIAESFFWTSFFPPAQGEECLSCPLHKAFVRVERSHRREAQGWKGPQRKGFSGQFSVWIFLLLPRFLFAHSNPPVNNCWVRAIVITRGCQALNEAPMMFDIPDTKLKWTTGECENASKN